MTARENLNDLNAFVAVAREKSFSRAAAMVGVSQSALSHTIRGMEARLGVRLLARTTRSVAPTEAGQRLLATVAPRLDEIAVELEALAGLQEMPAGNIRISAADCTASAILWRRLRPLLHRCPGITLEISAAHGPAEVLAGRFDAVVRLGEPLEKDVLAARISHDIRMTVVGAPSYLASRPKPRTPQDLTAHSCINLRLPARPDLQRWELRKGERTVLARVSGQITFDSLPQVFDAAVAGFGLAYLPEDMVREQLADGALACVMEDWFPTFTGYHLCYPGRRPASRAMAAVIEALRLGPPDAAPGA